MRSTLVTDSALMCLSALDAAKKNGVAVVPVTETLPQGQNYIQWMTANLAAIGKALGD